MKNIYIPIIKVRSLYSDEDTTTQLLGAFPSLNRAQMIIGQVMAELDLIDFYEKAHSQGYELVEWWIAELPVGSIEPSTYEPLRQAIKNAIELLDDPNQIF